MLERSGSAASVLRLHRHEWFGDPLHRCDERSETPDVRAQELPDTRVHLEIPDRLVHFETTSDVRAAIAREKQIKGWKRVRKVALIEAENPRWLDLSKEWD
jgi:hypothetical protein